MRQMHPTRGYLYNSDTNELYLNNNKYATKQVNCVIIKSRTNLIERYSIEGMMTIAERFQVQMEDHWTSDDLSKAIWDKFKEVTNGQLQEERRIKKENNRRLLAESRGLSSDNAEPRRTRTRVPRIYTVCFEKISQELRPLSGSRIPKQAREIIDNLRQQPNTTFTELEMKAYIESLAQQGKLTAHRGEPIKQPAWRVFLYYEAKLHQYGLVLRHTDVPDLEPDEFD